MRERIKTNNGWEWKRIDTADPDEVNINQMDIPISPGEQVEIQVKSVSEAGWPSNPMESEWSEPIIVSFSDFAELQSDNISEMVEQNRVDVAVANVTKMFSGTTSHMASSFYTNDKYFAHTAESITSGFLTPEQTPITLYDKLQELQNQITMIIEKINGTVGDIVVSLYDNSDEQKVYTLNEGSTTYINAGSYKSAVKSLNLENENGAIITKTFYIDISTEAQSGLFLLSKLTGDRLSMCPSTIGDLPTHSDLDHNDYESYDNIVTPSTTSGSYYMEQGRYDLVPINLTNPETVDFQIGSPSMYQSAQCRGQFIYSRFRNIGDTFDMYANCSDDDGKNPRFDAGAKFTASEETYEFKDNLSDDEKEQEVENYNSLTGSEVSSFDNNMKYILNRLPKTWIKTDSAVDTILNNKKILLRLQKVNVEHLEEFINQFKGRFSKLNTANYTISPKIQAAYGFGDLGTIHNDDLKGFDSDSSEDGGTSFITTHKIGYEERDIMAKGESSCNSYLFLSPINHKDIQVEGDSLDSVKGIKSGSSLRVPVIYQFRMKDADGKIFGISGLSEKSLKVKNAKFTNIIGIDIWTNRNALKPKQYDIIVYSTYDDTIDTNTNKTKTSSTQTLVSIGNDIVKKLDKLKSDNKKLTLHQDLDILK